MPNVKYYAQFYHNIAQYCFFYYFCPMKQFSDLPSWSLISAGIADVHSEWRYAGISSPFTRLYYILDGEGFIHFDDHTVHLTPGNLYIVPAFRRHSYSCPDFLRHIYLHVYEPDAGVESTSIDNWTFPDEIKASTGIVRIFHALVDQSPEISLPDPNPLSYDNDTTLKKMTDNDMRRPFYMRIANSSLIGLIMAEWFRYGNRDLEPTDPRVIKAIDFLRANYSAPITAAECAHAASISLFHFLRIFKASTGMTPLNYLRSIRMRRAQNLLAFTDDSVSTISRAVGYDDSNYFIRIFRRATGLTPARYRLLNR